MALTRPDMDAPIRQKDVSDEYRSGWDRVFGKKKKAKIPCCERDYDCDGNCDRHPSEDMIPCLLDNSMVLPRSVLKDEPSEDSVKRAIHDFVKLIDEHVNDVMNLPAPMAYVPKDYTKKRAKK